MHSGVCKACKRSLHNDYDTFVIKGSLRNFAAFWVFNGFLVILISVGHEIVTSENTVWDTYIFTLFHKITWKFKLVDKILELLQNINNLDDF